MAASVGDRAPPLVSKPTCTLFLTVYIGCKLCRPSTNCADPSTQAHWAEAVAFWGVTRFPETRRDDVVEVLHGRSIADPYRWLEDPDSAETADWVKRQNEFTAGYLESLPDRPWFLETMQQVMGRPRAGVPFKRARHYFVSRNDGSQNQDVIFVASSLQELLAGGRVLVDPNTSPETVRAR